MCQIVGDICVGRGGENKLGRHKFNDASCA
jgi:hypothetical protein